MPLCEVGDTVVLRNHPNLVGHVERTNTENHFEPLEDKLIIAHVEVPPNVLNDFVITGIPPKGFVFVEFTNTEDGYSVVGEQDLLLLSRLLDVGDTVKRPGSPMTGTVISVSESFTLQPICHYKPGQKLTRSSFRTSDSKVNCTPECTPNLPANISHPRPHELIYDVPGQELKYADDATEGDFVVYKEWVGIIEEVEIEVVLALEDDSIVVLAEADQLYLPLPTLDKPLVSLPDYEDVSGPEILVALQGWPETIPLNEPRRGQFAITNRKPLRTGRWLQGSYNKDVPAQGIIIDVRTRELVISWLNFNAFSSNTIDSTSPPRSTLSMYENLSTYRTPDEIRQRKGLIVYDTDKQPRQQPEHNMDTDAVNSPKSSTVSCPNTSQDIVIGDHVKFRDVTAAAVKYQGSDGNCHGRFNRIREEWANGWDLNEFKIIYMTQDATVLWQDGVTTTQPSMSLETFSIIETEIVPSDIVLKRDGLQQVTTETSGGHGKVLKDFNEMTFFEQPRDLLSHAVGIVQKVDPQERVAQVRWFQNPSLKLKDAGLVLGSKSRFGPIGDAIEEVSLYEIMSFPALARHSRNMVVIIPASLSKITDTPVVADIKSGDKDACGEKLPRDLTNVDMGEMFNKLRSRRLDHQLNANQSDGFSETEIDWLGEIIHLGLDGTITVRLGAVSPCQDVQISHDGIIILMTGEEEGLPQIQLNDSGEWSEDDAFLSDNDEPYFVARSFEYEGGERLDDDSGDENWVSDDEENEEASTQNQDAEMLHDGVKDQKREHLKSVPRNQPKTSLTDLYVQIPSEAPASFAILEGSVPSDQFGKDKDSPSMTTIFSKRVFQEHRILSAALPPNEIFVRAYETRLDLIRCLIVGPKNTPYEYAPFVIDLHLGSNFPKTPPTAYFHSWTGGLGRINPNLYEDGKICLSLLGTWPGKTKQEGWSEDATILQILLSLQGLVLGEKPFYNEAGFEDYAGEKAYILESQQYNEKAYVMARGFVKHALFSPSHGLEDILAWLYLPHPSAPSNGNLLATVLNNGAALVRRSQEAKSREEEDLMNGSGETLNSINCFLKPLSTGAVLMLKRTLDELNQNREVLLNDQRNAF